WLKANYPVQYLAALLTSVKSNLDKAAVCLNVCRRRKVAVLVPDVNASASDFVCELGGADALAGNHARDAIRFGLSAVRNVGEGVAELVIAARAEGPFVDFYDFCERVDPTVLNKRTVESLINAGAFDSLGHPRKGLLTVFEPIVDATLRRRRERDQGTMSLFDLGGGSADDDSPVFDDRLPVPALEFEKSERLRAEKEMLGLYVSDHPLMGAESVLRRHTECSIAEAADLDDGALRNVAGVVTALQRKYTKRGDLMA